MAHIDEYEFLETCKEGDLIHVKIHEIKKYDDGDLKVTFEVVETGDFFSKIFYEREE